MRLNHSIVSLEARRTPPLCCCGPRVVARDKVSRQVPFAIGVCKRLPPCNRDKPKRSVQSEGLAVLIGRDVMRHVNVIPKANIGPTATMADHAANTVVLSAAGSDMGHSVVIDYSLITRPLRCSDTPVDG